MLRISRAMPFLLFLCLLIPCMLQAQRPVGGGRPSGGVIDVQLRNPNGTPGPRGVHVRLESAEGGAEADEVTIEGGKCQFRLSFSGVYLVRISEPHYKEVTERVELIGTSRGYVTLELKPLPGAAPTPETPKTGGDSRVSVADLGVPEEASHEYELGEDALKGKNPDESIKHFKRAIELHETFPQAYTMLGTLYLAQQNWKEAQRSLERAIQLDPKLAEAYLELGAVFNQTKDYATAEQVLTKGLELKPDAFGGQYELGKTCWALGRWQDAAPHVRKAVEGMPNMPAPHALLGNILLRERNAPAALKEYQEYLRLDPDGPMASGVRDTIAKIEKALQGR
ncbi:MAG: tetratricopeptide repeat protein [Candidatus Acidiferrales bacterium]